MLTKREGDTIVPTPPSPWTTSTVPIMPRNYTARHVLFACFVSHINKI